MSGFAASLSGVGEATINQVAAPLAADAPWAVIAAGADAVVLAAPPTGYLYFIHRITIVNNSLTSTTNLTAGYRITVAAKEAYLSLLTTSVAASGFATLTGQLAHGAVRVYSTGLAPITAIVSYSLIPSAGIVCVPLELTNAFQTVLVTPAPGFVSAVGFHVALLGAISPTGLLMNADANAAVVTHRITRGSDVIDMTQASVAAFTRSVAQAPPAVRPGDVYEAKLGGNPAVAGKTVLWMFYQTLPLAA